MSKSSRKNIGRRLLSVFVCISALLIIFTVNAFAKENFKAGATYSMGGGQSTGFVNGSLVPLCDVDGNITSAAETWKVTLYVGKNNSVRLEDKPTTANYTRNTIIYSARGINTINQNSGCAVYMGNADKVAYQSKMVSFSPVRIKAKTEDPQWVGDQKFIIRSNVPRATYGSGQENYADRAIKYFLTDNRTAILNDFKTYFGVAVSDEVPWCLVLEPILRTFIQNGTDNVYVMYTATEYALAQSFSSDSGGYYDFDKTHMLEPYTFYNLPNYYRLVDGWLGMPTPTSDSYKWLNIPKTVFYTRGSQQRRDAEAYIESHWSDIKSSIVNYAGCAMYCSPYFDNSDYTLSGASNSEKFENETMELVIKVNRTNPEKAGTVKVTLKYNAPNCTIDGSAATSNGVTKSVSFAKNETQKELKWKIQVGTYPDNSSSREYGYTLTMIPENGTTDIKLDNNSLGGKIILKRDLQVTAISLDKSSCFENSNVTVNFSVKNANPYRAYSNVPVAVYFTYGGKTTKISETTLSFDKGATKSGSCTLNVGCVTANSDQTDTITVVLNSSTVSAESGSRYSEPAMANNKAAKTVKVKRDINLSVSIVDRTSWESYIGNAPSKVKDAGKTQAVTTCTVTNNSRFNLYESDPMGDKITVNFYVNNKLVGSKSVPIPRYGSNLVWFKWDVPDGSSVTLRAELKWNVDQENSPSPYADNTASISKSIKTVNKLSTPDTKLMMEHGSNKNYSKASAYTRFKPSVAKWSQWVCNSGGTFTRIDYAMTGDSALTLTPMKSASYYDGSTIASGSAFSAVFSYTVRTECSEAGYNVSTNDYTYAQNVVAMFPEFQYTNSGDCRTMYLVKEDGNLGNASFQFEKNPYIEDKQRVHFTPSNMPDGEYKVGVVASSMWTPAGPIYVNAASSVMINGSVYDDWSPNASVR